MSVILPNPDEIRRVPTGRIPLWACPHCGLIQLLEDYGLRLMNGDRLESEEADWRRQSWCYRCRMEKWGVSALDPAQPYLPDLLDGDRATCADEPDHLPDDLTNYFEGIQ